MIERRLYLAGAAQQSLQAFDLDWLGQVLVEAGSGALTLGTPSSPGIPTAIAAETVLAPYNDLAAAEAIFKKFPNKKFNERGSRKRINSRQPL